MAQKLLFFQFYGKKHGKTPLFNRFLCGKGQIENINNCL